MRLAFSIAFVLGLHLAAGSPPPRITFRHPRHDNTTVVNANSRVMIDMHIEGFVVGADGDICMDTGQLVCYNTTDSLAIVLPTAGHFGMATHLVRRRSASSSPTSSVSSDDDARSRIVASDWVEFDAVDRDQCEGRFGLSPCDGGRRPPRHCTAGFARFRFYMYPINTVSSTQAAKMYYALRDSPFRTDDPSEACVFIALTDPMVANTPRESAQAASARLTRAPFWGPSGEYHLVLHYGDYDVAFDTGRSILAKSSFGPPLVASMQEDINPSNPGAVPKMAQQRKGYDLVVPLPFYRCGYPDNTHLTRFDAVVKASSIKRPQARSVLLSFKGALYDFPRSHFAHIRQNLPPLHNGRDVIIAVTCYSVAPSCSCPDDNPRCSLLNVTSSRDPRCPQWHTIADATDFDELLLNSRFTIVAPGEGTHSYRLYEALQGGSVPVILGESATPLPELIAWGEIAVVQRDASPAALAQLVTRLKAMPLSRVEAMQSAGRLVFDHQLKDLQSQLHASFAALALRFQVAARKRGGESPATLGSSDSIVDSAASARDSAASSSDVSASVPVSKAERRAADDGENNIAHSESVSASGETQTKQEQTLISSEGAASAASKSLHDDHDEEGVVAMTAAARRRRARSAAQQQQPSPPARRPAESQRDSGATYNFDALKVALDLLPAVRNAVIAYNNSIITAGGSFSFLITSTTDTAPVVQSIALLLHWLANASSTLALNTRRRDVSLAYEILGQLYAVSGHWRAALTAVQAQAILLQAAADISPKAQFQADEALNQLVHRATNAMCDVRRPPPADESHSAGYAAPALTDASHLRGRLYRFAELLTDGDDVTLAGYGNLASYLAPVPLTSAGAPGAALLPLVPYGAGPSNGKALGFYHPDSVLAQVAVDEATLQRIAAKLQYDVGSGGASLLPTRLDKFMSLHSDKIDGGYLTPVLDSAESALVDQSEIAIVSLCVYNSSETALGRLSIANLQAYCDLHGYDCYIGTKPSALDPSRPPAWSKLLLLAQYLPRYRWVMWKDCDSFLMKPDVSVESVIAAAAAARGIIGTAVADVVYGGDASTAERLRASSAHDDNGQGPSFELGAPRSIPLPSSPSLDLIISEDGLMVNTGVFILRNSAWARRFIQRAYGVSIPVEPSGQAAQNENQPLSATLSSSRRLPTASHVPVANAAAAGQQAAAAMRASRPPFETNRAWEQASIFHVLALAGGPGTSSSSSPSADIDNAAADGTSQSNDSGSGRISLEDLLRNAVHGRGSLLPSAYADASHVQAVPQAWINSYPQQLAGQLHDHKGRPLHAPYAPGDWMVSFSGCGTLMGPEQCESLFEAYARQAAEAAEAALAAVR